MRYRHKKNIVELLETIISVLEDQREPNEEEEIMLTDCIDAFSQISMMVKEYDVISDMSSSIVEKIKSLLERETDADLKEISYIVEDIENLKKKIVSDIKGVLRVLFLPYKASMWDSLESIWKVACEDEMCECKVVSIPYCELDENKVIKCIKNEFGLYPEYVNVINANNYNIQKDEPDIAFIHNPYDSYNRITIIDPLYFTQSLKQYVGMLVYVPYFVAGSYKNYESHEELVNYLPGVVNSDRVIALSDTHKELFIKEGNISDEKVIALGSPKFDAVLNNEKSMDIPSDWKKKIKGRKVFLLSTGITNLLGEKDWFGMIKEILKPFLESDEHFLIWRRHPLMNLTIESMRCSLLNEFMKLEEDIINKENIMIDTSDDAYMAFRASDALMSDYSSILFQYILTGKPILGLMEEWLRRDERVYVVDYRGIYFLEKDFKIEDFIEVVKEDKDYKKEERMDRLSKSVLNLDGTCGRKVYEVIKNQFLENK